ncbi:MAG: NADH-quinone oxidoreductase subunit D, partial [Candidatus Eremiobacteraeota bacterium]|nr:NADH-quinone oxidoreductase subunit D [Candidatus Eremiobacteraeota bacterium]
MSTTVVPGGTGGYSMDVIDRGDNGMVLSMGPQHPSTHGVL